MEFILPLDNRERPDSELLDDLRAVAARLGFARLTLDQYKVHGRFGCETGCRRFGSWNKALMKAGLSISKRHAIPTTELIGELAALWMKLGRPPSRDDYKKHATGISASAIEGRFHGWRKALEAVVEAMNLENSLPFGFFPRKS